MVLVSEKIRILKLKNCEIHHNAPVDGERMRGKKTKRLDKKRERGKRCGVGSRLEMVEGGNVHFCCIRFAHLPHHIVGKLVSHASQAFTTC